MKSIGIICEFNPFHNGHLYFINQIKKMYPGYIIILILNGYFLERGEISIICKENKTKISLNHGIDIVVELPFIYGTQSADIFSEASVKLLNYLNVEKIIFGSESNDISLLENVAKEHLNNKTFHKLVKTNLKKGYSYPKSVGLASKSNIKNPNDILGVTYIKSILKNKYKIKYETIKRTSDFHDNESNNNIVSASNIRDKINNNEKIDKYIPKGVKKYITSINYDLLFDLLKLKIITDHNLNKYVGVNEGLEFRIKKHINKVDNYNDLVKAVTTKRYTQNNINRTFTHILCGLLKKDLKKIKFDYIKVLGFNNNGKSYLNKIKKEIKAPLIVDKKSKIYDYELKASLIYDQLTNGKSYKFEHNNKPIIK